MGKEIHYSRVKLESPFDGDNKKINSRRRPAIPISVLNSNKYYLHKNIYWVKGAANSVLHDFNLGVLYWLNHDTTLFLEEILDTKKTISKEAKSVVQQFIEAEILTDAEQNSSNENIETILVSDEKIKSCYIELTNLCNLKCAHCYNEGGNKSGQSLTLEEFKRIADDLTEYGVEKIQLIGGEPLMLKKGEFFAMLDYASDRFKSIEIYTNGTLLDAAMIERIAKYPKVKFSVAIYSFIESEHDNFTGITGSHKKTINAINLLKRDNIPTKYTGIRANNLVIGNHEEFSLNHRLDYIRLAGRGSLKLYNPALLRDRLRTLDSFNYEWSKDNVLNLYRSRCFSRLLYISSNLDVFPCAMERRLKHGNLKNNGLADIIQKSILNYSKNEVESCKDCEFRYICVACPPDSLSGKLGDKPWYCTYDVQKGKWLDVEKFVEDLMNLDNNDFPLVQTGGCRTGIV